MQQQVESAGQLVAESQASGLGLGGLGGVGGLGGLGGGLGLFLRGYEACGGHSPCQLRADSQQSAWEAPRTADPSLGCSPAPPLLLQRPDSTLGHEGVQQEKTDTSLCRQPKTGAYTLF